MKAIVYREHGSADVLHLENVGQCHPNDKQVLIKVHASSANPLDWHTMRGVPYVMRMGAGYGRPLDPRMGVDVAGEVVAVGKDVTRFKPGDEVYGVAPGAFAEYARASERRLALKPACSRPKARVLVGGGGPNDGRWIGAVARPVKALLLSPFVSTEMVMMLSDVNGKDLDVLSGLMLAGKVKPVIDRTYRLSEARDAIDYLEKGRARGKVVIVVDAGNPAGP